MPYLLQRHTMVPPPMALLHTLVNTSTAPAAGHDPYLVIVDGRVGSTVLANFFSTKALTPPVVTD